MKRVLTWSTFVVLVAGCSGSVASPAPVQSATTAPQTEGAPRTHAAVAADSLKTVAQLVHPQRTLGFQSIEETASAELAEPLPMLAVGLKDLQAYKTGADPSPMFLDEHAVFYPLTVAGEARSGMILRNDNGAWRASAFGLSALATRVHAGRARLMAERGVAVADVSLVEIPGLSTHFLAHEEGGVMMVTLLDEVHGSDLRAGTLLPAADLFAKLQPLVARSN